MIDLAEIRYVLRAMDENGKQYDISDYVQNLGWEENENELSVRLSFTVKNDETSKGFLSDIIKPGCLVAAYASRSAFQEDEVARGYVENWSVGEKNSGTSLRCTCYDGLSQLQNSQDNRYFPPGTGTKQAVQGILDDWEIPQGEYLGPDVAHGKTVFNNRYISDIILSLLDDAVKKGGEKCILRETQGKASVVPWGGNRTVYVFEPDNMQAVSRSVSTADLITRVKVVGQTDDDGKHSVQAVLNGLTRYGIRQRIYTRGSDESLSDAELAAQEILDTDGKIKREMSVQAPDVPYIRKGDQVYFRNGQESGYYYVKGIRHNADVYSMSIDLEPAVQETVRNDTVSKVKEYSAGDIVQFHGGTHYVSSYPGSKGYAARAGQARITMRDGSGGAHPWHLIHTDAGSNVYGWVDDGTFD